MSIPQLLLDRLPADFHERLCNWGDVMRSRGGYGVSPTYEICRMLAKKAGKLPRGEEPEKELDEDDAGFIEAAWRNSVYRMLHQHREILRAHYVQKAYWKATCRAQSIRLREYDDTLVRAVGNFEDFVAQYAMRVHNRRQDNLTTV
ncbi:hypothetical protein AL520_09195 [Achromobacter xylosoxidans]|nr:hypothetical protein AL520_09195 [Achromobacter xylosoxidans]